MSVQGVTTRQQVLDEIRAGERFLVVTHENPDGDALGSLVAMHALLKALGKDCLMYLSPADFPLPYEYRFFRFDDLVTAQPPDLATRTTIFLDCGNVDRSPLDVSGLPVLNIDHHHDNTRFGTVNHVVDDASCTAEIVWDLMQALGVPGDREIAEALYVGLVTDTGRFMYENTGRTAHLMAADLIDRGIDVEAIYRRLYEGTPFAKLELLGRALQRVRRFDGGALTFAYVTLADLEETGAEESYTEGIVDHLRAVEGTKVAALVRERACGGDDGQSARKASLRSTDGTVDVSAIARAQGGGGHRRAAGFSTDLSIDEIVAFLRDAVAEQLGR
ncbi:MAG: bifunctional oligoribonuclease/PAP phosphatase NrnA [Solirubrobacteraceae bacterium]|nr:bifunctional oligoribonuclease/PAP phosphatase NrnA [Solirubrobacteraceae bacterium]